jgi:hypothetical protein
MMADFANGLPHYLKSSTWDDDALCRVEDILAGTPCSAGTSRTVFRESAAPRLLAQRWGAITPEASVRVSSCDGPTAPMAANHMFPDGTRVETHVSTLCPVRGSGVSVVARYDSRANRGHARPPVH